MRFLIRVNPRLDVHPVHVVYGLIHRKDSAAYRGELPLQLHSGEDRMTPTSFDTNAVIVGTGPVSANIANTFGIYDASVLVMEKVNDIVDCPRTIGIDDKSLRTACRRRPLQKAVQLRVGCALDGRVGHGQLCLVCAQR